MDIELFGGPLDDCVLDHDVESEQELIEAPWIAIISKWVEHGEGAVTENEVESAYVYKYVGNGYAIFNETIYEENCKDDKPDGSGGSTKRNGGALFWN
jgi:hypothetical protein